MNAKKSVVLAAAVALACGGSVDPAGPGADPSQQGAEVAISPSVANVVAGGMIAFTATVTGLANTAVAWSVEEGSAGGSVTSSGLYSAPSTTGSYHVLVASAADATKTARATINVGTTSPPVSSFGTGTTYAPVNVTNVTGGGAMPSTANGYTASCAGDGVTDDTACLRAAATSAAGQGKPLLIPYTANGYLISGPIDIATSVIGTGTAAPLIRMATGTGNGTHRILQISGYQGSGLWITNLHLKGPFSTTASGEWDHGIWVVNSRNITIKGNLIENVAGDSIMLGDDPDRLATNVLIDGNTLRNPYRCAVALVYSDRTWVGNNVIEKPVNYVSAIDFEPDATPQGATNAEVAYNKFVMNNRTPGRYGSDGRASSAWQNANVATPGGNLYLHHNYGTFGVGWWMTNISYKGGNGDWYNVVQSSNVEGSSVP